ncbi:unnamed protein product [Camellia sinensis]
MATKNMKSPFRGIINDFKGRKVCYNQDWHDAFCSGTRILYGSLSTVDTLASTAICGIIHSMFGGQPLLILGVAEPTVIMYTYLYNFTKEKADLGQELFLVCVWIAILLLLPAAFNACTIINRFTRIAGELFGTLIAVLFMQEAIKGGWQRSFIADYGVPCMVLIWSLMPFGVPTKVPSGVPRRLFGPLPWEADGNQDHFEGQAILFNETITQTLLYGLIGLPPANGVLPQSPMHTKSLSVLKRQLIRKKMVKSAKECIKKQRSNSEIYGRMQAVFIEMDTTPDHAVAKKLKNLKDAVMKSEDGGSKDGNDLEKDIDAHLPVRVNEQKTIKMIPTSVLWGYFAYMALDSLPGNQFCERILLLFITPKRRVLEGDHASFVKLYLQELDAAEYEEIAGNRNRNQSMPFKDGGKPLTGNENHEFEISDAEILDELTTYRGQLKFRSASFNDECL